MSDQQPYNAPEMPYNSIPPPPVAQAGTPLAPPSGRPTAALVIGIILIAFAAFSLYGISTQIAQLIGNTASPIIIPKEVRIISLCHSLLGLGLYLLMGIGLLKMFPWARKGTIISLIVLFALSLIASTLTLSTMTMPTGLNSGLGGNIVHTVMVVTLTIVLVFSLVINGLFIFFLTRPNVVKAFRDAGER